MRARLSILFALCLATPAVAGDAKDFKRAWSETQNSWERITLINGLDPADEDSFELLTEYILKTQDWYYREAAIDVLAGAYSPEILEELEKQGKRGDAVVAEGVAMAFGRSGNTDRVPFLVEELLDHKKWKVVRAAAIALGNLPDKRAVGPLIECWEENEEDFMVWVHVLEALEKITREKNMPRHQDWKAWWDVVKDTWEVPEEQEIDEDEAKSGDVIKTRVRDTNLELRSRGSGLPLLVLPEYGYEKDYLETYLRNLEDTNQILYCSLPGASDFPNLPNAPGMPYPYYPLELLVDAFEDLHKELVEGKMIEDKPFAIMAHGLSCWIAMKYAAKYPRRVRRMILIAPTSGGKAWGEGRDRVERAGQQNNDLEMEHYAQSQVFENGAPRYQAQSDEESAALQRKGHTLYFADTRDLEIGRIYGPVVEKVVGDSMFRGPAAFRPMGSITIPDFSLFKEQRSQTQTIIMMGAHTTRVSKDDCDAIAKHYRPSAKVIVFRRSNRMPFIEENEQFVKVVRKLLGGGRR